MIPFLFIMAAIGLIGVSTNDKPQPKTVIVESCETYRTQKVCKPEYRRVK